MKTKFRTYFRVLILVVFVVSCNKDNNQDIKVDNHLIEEVPSKTGFITIVPSFKEAVNISSGKAPPTIDQLLPNIQYELSYLNGVKISTGDFTDLVGGQIEVPADVDIQLVVWVLYNADALYGNYIIGSVSENENVEFAMPLGLLDAAVTINFGLGLDVAFPDLTVQAETDNYLYTIQPSSPTTGVWDLAQSGEQRFFAMDELTQDPFNPITITENNSADLTISITASGTTGSLTATKTYPSIKKNEHYNITIKNASGDGTSITLTLEVIDETVIEDTIIFSGISPTEDCLDGIDNDGDGLIDCNDPDCNASVACES